LPEESIDLAGRVSKYNAMLETAYGTLNGIEYAAKW